MLEAEVIPPLKSKAKIACDDCLLSYTHREYGLLKKSKKLLYFCFIFPGTLCKTTLCHECLFKNLKEISGGNPISIKIRSLTEEFLCNLP